MVFGLQGSRRRQLSTFFKSSKEGGAPSEQDISLGIRAQVRALTDGDITKQQAVFETDCWAALTELDEKAREAEEFKQKTKNNERL